MFTIPFIYTEWFGMCTWDVSRLSKSVKKLSPGGSSFFTLSECLEASRVHGSHNPVRKPFGIPLFYWAQGRRKLLKVREGGQALRGTIREKKGNLKNFFDGGRVISKKFSGHTEKIIRIYPKYENIFPDIPKNFPDIWYFFRKRK